MAKTNVPASPNTPRPAKGKGATPTADQGVLESPDALRERFGTTEDFFKQHQKSLVAAAVALGLLIAGIALYFYNQRQREQQAQEYMFPAVYYFEADSLDRALNGDGVNYGLRYIADEYGSTEAGTLADFYVGTILLKQGQFAEAIDYLKEVNTDDLLIQPRAYALIGDGYVEQNNWSEAITFYNKAAAYQPTEAFTPGYLMKLGLAYERNDQLAEAAEAYGKVVADYPQSQEAVDAKRYRALAAAGQTTDQ